MASFSDSAFSTGAFGVTAWDFGSAPPPASVVGGHFGRKKRKDRRPEEFAAARERLRAQILEAIDGPSVPEPIRQFVLEPQADARWTPPALRIDWDAVYAQIENAQRAIEQAIEDDDDEDWLLLNG